MVVLGVEPHPNKVQAGGGRKACVWGGAPIQHGNNTDEFRLQSSHQEYRHHFCCGFTRKEKARGPGAVTGGGHG